MDHIIETEENDNVIIRANNLEIIIKHNDIGISIDYYPIADNEPQPFREDQVWWEDVPE
jgi:hypothetical protein